MLVEPISFLRKEKQKTYFSREAANLTGTLFSYYFISSTRHIEALHDYKSIHSFIHSTNAYRTFTKDGILPDDTYRLKEQVYLGGYFSHK